MSIQLNISNIHMAIDHNILDDNFNNIQQHIDYLRLQLAVFSSLPTGGKTSIL